MNAVGWAIRQKFSLLLFIILATAIHSGGQEDALRARIIWQKEFDSGIWHRQYMHNVSEPDVGISSYGSRTNPVSMVATGDAVYIFDGQGNIERRVSLKWENIPDDLAEGDQREFTRERATTSPDGQFYVILTYVRQASYEKPSYPEIRFLRAFNADSSLRFELGQPELLGSNKTSGDGDQQLYISPKGDYMVVFYNGWFLSPYYFLNFYDTKGSLIKRIGDDDFLRYEFSPFDLGFSADGSQVILTGFKTEDLLIFDAQGNMIRKVAGDIQVQKAARQARDAIKRILEPEAVNARFQRGGRHTSGIAEFRLIKDRNQGIYAKGGTLYLFELERDQKGGKDDVR